MKVHSFSARLGLGVLVLVILTTLSAGAPAFWLTQTQLERQAWAQVENIRQATRSLLQADESRLLSLAQLFAERPTLQRLVTERARTELQPYVAQFQSQSQLDLLAFCGIDGTLWASQPPLTACPTPDSRSVATVAGQPTLLVSVPVRADANDAHLGTAVVGLWLDEAFLQQLAADTGTETSVLTAAGERLVSTLPAVSAGAALAGPVTARDELTVGGQPFFVTRLPLTTADDHPAYALELALPVAALRATARQALLILIASTGCVALAGAGLAFWTIHRMTRPLGQLTRIAREIAQGDFVAPIPTFSGPLEVTTLAVALQRSHASMRQALDELAQARDWLDNLIQSIVEGVLIIDRTGRVTFLSQGAATLIGTLNGEGVGTSINDLFRVSEDEDGRFQDALPSPGQQRTLDVITRRGQPITLAITSARLSPLPNAPSQLALVLRDVTEEAAARHLRAYFLANITHEFRTPLSTLKASLELLLDETEALSPAEMRQVLKSTYLSLLSLQTLIDNLLEGSKIEAGRFTIHRRPIDLPDVIARAVQIVQPLLERRSQVLHQQGLADVHRLQADAAALTQVLVNLLTNASKYSPVGEPVDLQIQQHAAKLQIAVADRGPGIPAAERAQLFRRFVRLTEQGGEQYGIGLGLYVVKTTVEAHGGQVGVDERPGGGSIFWFELPYEDSPG
jgi:signal transduction histidine kinase